jgi:hypothetical protein
VNWWEKVAKKQLSTLFVREATERRRDERNMENFYYACIYDILQSPHERENRIEALNLLKAKIGRLNGKRLEGVNIDVDDHESLRDERVSLFHLTKRRTRREQRNVTQIVGRDGRLNVETREIKGVFHEHLCQKYVPIKVDNESIRTMLSVNHKRLDLNERDALSAPPMLEEVRQALRKGRGDTAPGRDGIGVMFFKEVWDSLHGDIMELFTQMFSVGAITTQQKGGVIVCIPKTANPKQPHEYRPIKLLSNDYKTLARLMASRMSEVLRELLHPSQYCGVKGKMIFEAAGTIRDVIAHTEVTRQPLCVISVDFKEAFDRISHDYLFATLKSYGFSDKFVGEIKHMYSEVRSVVQINGHISVPIPIRCGIRQGCPLSMIPFALCLDPLICWLEEHLHCVSIRSGQRKAAVVAYADDVTVLATKPEDIEVLREALD